MVDLSPRCSKCSRPLESNGIRALPNGTFMCIDCYEQKTKTYSPRGEKKDSYPEVRPMKDKPQLKRDTVSSEEGILEPKNYICVDCKYRFQRNADFAVKACPYCGKESVHEYKPLSADSLVSSSQGQ